MMKPSRNVMQVTVGFVEFTSYWHIYKRQKHSWLVYVKVLMVKKDTINN